MKIKLIRSAEILKEVECSATANLVEIHRFSVDLMFEYFERDETRIWPREPDTQEFRYEMHVVGDEGGVLKAYDIRAISTEAGLTFLNRRPNAS